MIAILLRALPSAVMLFWAILIFLRKDVRPMQILMSAALTVGVISFFSGGITALFIFPFYFVSIRSITSSGKIPKWDWLIFLPSAAFLFIDAPQVLRIYLCVQSLALCIWTIIDTVRYNRAIAEFFDTGNDTSDENVGQIVFYMSATVVLVIIMVLLPEDIVSIPAVSVILWAFIAVLQFLTGYDTYNISEPLKVLSEDIGIESEAVAPSVADIPSAAEDSALQPESGISDGLTSYGYDKALLQRVIDEKLFLDPMVSLVSLADKLRTNRTYLSNTIHSCCNKNFSDYINTLRIRYACELMKEEGSDINIKEIAMRSGYNHMQSFYRNFATIMEMTPKEWIARK